MTQTIAQQIKWNFKTNGSLEIKDTNGYRIYIEFLSGFWEKYERNSQGNLIYGEKSTGYWARYEYDSGGNQIYFENSDGLIKDNRPKTCEGKIVEIGGDKFKLVKV